MPPGSALKAGVRVSRLRVLGSTKDLLLGPEEKAKVGRWRAGKQAPAERQALQAGAGRGPWTHLPTSVPEAAFPHLS